ncbi:MAG: hypothetical protein MI865_10685 [Proteobacteria bacterium]|nr:hypothetical protein [Pseudomonadota bacterium]
MKEVTRKSHILSFLNLFTSLSTIVCCALPAILVSLGAGAVLAGIVSSIPQLITLSKYKEIVFLVAGILLLVTGYIQWHNRNAPCPADPEMARTCMQIRKTNKLVYVSSVLLYLIGFFFAFIAVKLV